MAINKEEARELARRIGDLVNAYVRDDEEGAFLDELMHREHRTLQRGIGRLFLQFIVNMGDPMMAKYTDPRNDRLHEVGTIIRRALEEEGRFIYKGKISITGA